jgi:hypothetical protein
VRSALSGQHRLGFTVSAERAKLIVIVFNAGVRPVVLRDIDLELGRFRPESDNSIESILAGRRLPIVLSVGEHERFEHELSEYKSYLPDRLFEAAQKKFPWNRQLYFVVTTGTGRTSRHRLPKGDRSALVRKGT